MNHPEIPKELASFPEAAELWPKLLRRARPENLRWFGIDDLAFRLTCQAERERRNGSTPDICARARIWRLIAEKCSPGTSEVKAPNETELQQWMPGGGRVAKTTTRDCLTCGRKMHVVGDSKFFSCRECRGARHRSDRVPRTLKRTGDLPEGWKLCVVCNGPFEPKRTDALHCSRRCRNVSNNRKRDSERLGEADNAILEPVSP